MDAVTGHADIDLTLVNSQQRSVQDEILDRLELNTSGSQSTSGRVASNSSIPHGISITRADQRNSKSVSSGVSHLLKYLLLGEIKVSVATLISVTLAILAVVYTVLSDNVGQKQLDLGKWVFCKSYPDDPQVQNSTTCQIYSQKKSLDDLRRRDSTTLSETPIQILDSVPDWLSVPSRIDRHSCQVVCWNSASSHTHVALAPARISRSYVDVADSFRFILSETIDSRLGILTNSCGLLFNETRNNIRSFFHDAAAPQLKMALNSWLFSFTKVALSIRFFILDFIIPQLKTLSSSPNSPTQKS